MLLGKKRQAVGSMLSIKNVDRALMTELKKESIDSGLTLRDYVFGILKNRKK